MSLQERIAQDLKESFKAGDQFRTGVLRLLTSIIQNKTIELRAQERELDDESLMQLLRTEAKKRKESSLVYERGGRTDLAQNELKELVVLEAYLPKQLSVDEITIRVRALLEREHFSDFGSAMKVAMEELRGIADAKLVSEIVKTCLGQ
ncbi:MAG: glutamyl-tRNA amidotransferase [Candidatus Harrisonbacteria bacterium CG10_big_fil_rev_8_21_14_0_10_42_17]|uniref:Glutamyl-tRNA amidotransferase n=1 Tax=Candidatus Harrisonbacteria bacterium CG10_big_fil_rev_8_21_14_0_10_42_17 TaxID=1974584 RepID=A0A2M6WII3_9BACT|nr:MAG: glutamyl-tRNA amidotransferase [Candidatus Harrisonbacteria bacterium CG10_big_fil_rev_8_21_14_0_10_42_17]